ncbi:hypothetical protein HPB47_002892 [Ixodes persulcatus]|uniref:Uncharacterized protein n=1 Tax=Ixodes persulcatus TaxID=34615 RepID=A0AC60PJZ5_IXOPE|nr:hypothetical protein HPB47_002892 [Ixodes persulcatus]
MPNNLKVVIGGQEASVLVSTRADYSPSGSGKSKRQKNRRRPQNGSSNRPSTSSILKEGGPSGATPGQRGRSGSFPRLPQHERQSRRDVSHGPGTRDNSTSSQHRSRSSSRRRSPSIHGRQNQRRNSRSPSRNGRQLTGSNQTNKARPLRNQANLTR